MPEMGKYCKAYLVSSLRKFSGWKENLSQLRKETQHQDGKDIDVPRDQLQDDDVLFLQENYIVTDGIFRDQNIIFDQVTDEWKQFCTSELGFEIPDLSDGKATETMSTTAPTATEPST